MTWPDTNTRRFTQTWNQEHTRRSTLRMQVPIPHSMEGLRPWRRQMAPGFTTWRLRGSRYLVWVWWWQARQCTIPSTQVLNFPERFNSRTTYSTGWCCFIFQGTINFIGQAGVSLWLYYMPQLPYIVLFPPHTFLRSSSLNHNLSFRYSLTSISLFNRNLLLLLFLSL